MEDGASEEVCDRVISALADKALILRERNETVQAEGLLRDAEAIGAALLEKSGEWENYVISYLRPVGIRASVLLESDPRTACTIFSDALCILEGKGTADLRPEVLDRIAMTWIGLARRSAGSLTSVKSPSIFHVARHCGRQQSTANIINPQIRTLSLLAIMPIGSSAEGNQPLLEKR